MKRITRDKPIGKTKPMEEQLINATLRRTHQNLSVVEAKTLIRSWLQAVAHECERGRRVEVPRFGVFYRAQSKARDILNPITGERMRLPRMRRLGFKASVHQKWSGQ